MTTTLTVKLDKTLRDAAKKTADRLGIPLSTVVNAQLADFVRSGAFSVSIAPKPERVAAWERLSTSYDAGEGERVPAQAFIVSLRR